jgi:hypothetical protein
MAHFMTSIWTLVFLPLRPEDVAPVVLDLGNGPKINKEGAFFTLSSRCYGATAMGTPWMVEEILAASRGPTLPRRTG